MLRSNVHCAGLKNIEDITADRRLSKHQVIKNGFEFDVYVQGQSVLRVPYEQAVAGSVIYDGVRVACIEHLLALKTVAYADRRMSSKGRKDARDLLRLAVLSQVMETPIRPELLAPYLNVKEVALLESVSSGPDPMVLAKGNAHHARQFREAMDQVVAACRLPSPPSGMKP